MLAAMKMLGLNPMEQEIIDVTNEIARNGLIYFPEFCRVVHTRYSTVQYTAVQYSTVQYRIVHYTAVQYSRVQYTAPQVQGRGRGGLQAEHVQGGCKLV